MGEAIKGFPWRRGMSSRGFVLRDEDIVEIKQDSDYGMAPDREDAATKGAFLGAVREAYPEWFAISCQYRGSVEAWNVVARRKDYRDRNDHRILGEGATEWDAIEAAWNARPGVKRG